MAEGVFKIPTKPPEPSPWWLKGGAIFIAFMGFFSLIGTFSFLLGGVMMEGIAEDMDPEEICQDDDDPQDCEALMEWVQSFSDLGLWDIGAAFSAFLFLFSIPTAAVMWNAEDRDTALKLGWAWIVIHATSQLYITHSYMTWLDDLYAMDPNFDFGWIRAFNIIAGYGSVLFCEAFFAAVLALISYQTRPPTALEVPSAFHDNDQ
ncbi:MAG: hypothetical protein CMB78_03845 [Euryarchaeota archaeon]|nr:hypothetical protein [Euryarchaeota archaeon]